MHMCKKLGLHRPKLIYYAFGNFDMTNVHRHRSNSPAKMCKQMCGVEMTRHIYSYARCSMPWWHRPKLVMYKIRVDMLPNPKGVVTQMRSVTCKK